MNIIGYIKDESLLPKMKQWAMNNNAPNKFVELGDTYDKVCKEKNCNQLVAYAQFAKETGFLYKNGSAAGLNASFCNPCGLKKSQGGGDFDKNAHSKFDNWEQGISAQVDHLLLYAGAKGYPKNDTPDPRHFSFLLGASTTVEGLGGLWAPSKEYGNDIVAMVNKIKNTEVKIEDIEEYTNNEIIIHKDSLKIDSDIAKIIERISKLYTADCYNACLVFDHIRHLLNTYIENNKASVSDDARNIIIDYSNRYYSFNTIYNEYDVLYHINPVYSRDMVLSNDVLDKVINVPFDANEDLNKFINILLIIVLVFNDRHFTIDAFNDIYEFIYYCINKNKIDKVINIKFK